jgi:hypothetical protein
MTSRDQTDQDDVLLTKINAAVKAVNEAEADVKTAQAELVSRAKAAGLLLLEAKKKHPTVKGFASYLQRVDGLALSRAYDFMRLAGGRVTDEQLRQEARERQRRLRAKRAKQAALPGPEPKQPNSVTVTETPAAVLNLGASEIRTVTDAMREQRLLDVEASARALQEFELACRTYLPRMNAGDLRKARDYFNSGAWKPKEEAA